jgi:diguanylate cyclase (GGDEF)-like protein
VGFRSKASGAGRSKLFEGQRVLLVEDTRLYSVAVRSLLESRFGLIVIHCATLAALRREIESGGEKYDAAILDLCLADAPNGETLDYVVGCAIPAIVFSGYTSDARRQDIIAGASAELVYKNSPRSLEDLAQAIERVLGSNRLRALLIDPEATESSEMVKAMDGGTFVPVHCQSAEQALSILDDAKGTIELVVVRHDIASVEDFALLGTLSLRFGEDALRVVGFGSDQAAGEVGRFLKAGGDDFLQLPMSAADIDGRLDHTLAIHRQIQSLQRMASRDYLTDMLNRRYFFDRGPKMVEMCLRQSAPVCTALLDIDHFKRLNDTYGHEIGDLVLKAVSRRLLQLVGEKQHLPARIGGEEFALLLTNMNIEQAYEFCERIRIDISNTKIVVDDEDLSVTVSMGLAHISDSETFDNYLNAADQYLYLAKHSGRNRVFSDYQVLKIAAS